MAGDLPSAPVAYDSQPSSSSAPSQSGGETQRERMMQGRLYLAVRDPQLARERAEARTIVRRFNNTSEEQTAERFQLLEQLLQQKLDPDNPPLVEPPFACDYGYNLKFGKGVYINFNACFLDCNTITIGDDCLFGPYVQIYPPGHPLDSGRRDGMRGPEYALPVTIGKGCWIGGSAIIMGGVTIGDGCTIGAGAVVTRSIPPNSVAVGNPARVIKTIKTGEITPKEVP